MAAAEQHQFWVPPPNTFAPGANDVKLNVGIIGAGIGGLMSAIGLLEAGHNVEIFERSRFANETGAAINMTPNSSRILSYYKFDWQHSMATKAENMIIFQQALENKIKIPMLNQQSTYGSPWYFLHRVDLHNELKLMATVHGVNGNVAKLHLSTAVADVEIDGLLTLADGRTMKKDLIVVADGIRASFCANVAPAFESARHVKSMSRFLIPSEKLMADPEIAPLFEDGQRCLRMFFKGPESLVFYGCRGGDLQNFGLLYEPGKRRQQGNDSNVSKAELQTLLQDYPPSVKKIAEYAENAAEWDVYVRQPLDRLSNGRVVLVGDAAHPMPPFRALGGAMAVEDGAALGVLLSHVKTASQVPDRLVLFNEVRRKRTAAVQAISALHDFAPDNIKDAMAPWFDNPADAPKSREEADVFCLGGNVIRDAMIALEKHRQVSSL